MTKRKNSMVTKNEKETAVMANQMLLLMLIEDLSHRSNDEQLALLRVARYKQRMDEKHILCNDEKLLDKYYDLVENVEYEPSFWSKLKYTLCSMIQVRWIK